VVDEDYDARTLLSDLLRSMGLRVRTCDTAASCIEMLQKEPADLLFLDVEMPEREVSRIVAFVNGDHRFENTRTVVITRNDVEGGRQEWMRDAAAEVVYEGNEHAEALLSDLRGALTSLGASV
jgi:CheY-like chemotaxis protein